jgi:GxxExxY protein
MNLDIGSAIRCSSHNGLLCRLISSPIILLAMRWLYTAKGSGYRENTYQKDLETHFDQSTLPFVAQKLLDVFDSVDSRRLIGYYIPDFIVDNRVIVEIKALHGLDNSHIAQVIGYLAVTGCEVGLLINFGQRSLEWKRVLPPQRIQDHKVNRQWLFVPEWLQEK